MIEPEELVAWCRAQAKEVQIDTDTGLWLVSARGVAQIEMGLARRVGADHLRQVLAAADPRTVVGVANARDARFDQMTLNELALALALAAHAAPEPARAEASNAPAPADTKAGAGVPRAARP